VGRKVAVSTILPKCCGDGCGLTVGRLGGDLEPIGEFHMRFSFGNWLLPSRRRQGFCAASTSLKTMASAVRLSTLIYLMQKRSHFVGCRVTVRVCLTLC
jgi:hypothetical protein